MTNDEAREQYGKTWGPPEHGLSFREAAMMLGTTWDDIFDQVFLRQIEVVMRPGGRPYVDRRAVERRLREREAAEVAG